MRDKEAQPPRRLSPILPTRADNAANTVFASRRISGKKCLAINAGPTVLIRSTSSIVNGSNSAMLFSGRV